MGRRARLTLNEPSSRHRHGHEAIHVQPELADGFKSVGKDEDASRDGSGGKEQRGQLGHARKSRLCQESCCDPHSGRSHEPELGACYARAVVVAVRLPVLSS